MLIRAEFKKEIANSNWVNERISEVFDDATEMMSENSIIYGGAIRDALAEKELSGDIDIATSVKEYDSVIAKFRHSVKWVSKNGPLGTKNQDYRIWLSKLFNIASFIHMNGSVAQVIAVNTKDVCSIVRDVDIVCCAVIMTSDGHVFEVVDGAYDDCVAKVLRLNKTKNIVNINDTPERIKKLVGRGWKSLITDKQIERAISKYKKSAGIAINQSKLVLHDHSGRPIKKHGNGPYSVSGRLSVPEGSRKNISIIEKS